MGRTVLGRAGDFRFTERRRIGVLLALRHERAGRSVSVSYVFVAHFVHIQKAQWNPGRLDGVNPQFPPKVRAEYTSGRDEGQDSPILRISLNQAHQAAMCTQMSTIPGRPVVLYCGHLEEGWGVSQKSVTILTP